MRTTWKIVAVVLAIGSGPAYAGEEAATDDAKRLMDALRRNPQKSAVETRVKSSVSPAVPHAKPPRAEDKISAAYTAALRAAMRAAAPSGLDELIERWNIPLERPKTLPVGKAVQEATAGDVPVHASADGGSAPGSDSMETLVVEVQRIQSELLRLNKEIERLKRRLADALGKP